jgi:hypothetical protein
VNDLQAAYRFLKITAFHDMRLPARVRIEARPLRNAWGYYYDNKKIEIDSRIKTWDKRLKVLAHEMVHAALDQAGAFDTSVHGEAFKTIAAVVCERMGWPTKGF